MKSQLTRREFVCGSAAGVAASLALPQWSSAAEPPGAWSLENEYLQYVVGPDARGLRFLDRQSGRDYCGGKAAVARVKKAGKQYDATAAEVREGRLVLKFGDSGVQVVLKGIAHSKHVVLEVAAVAGEGVEELTLIDLPLALHGTPQEPFAACALALNLRTNVAELPQPGSRLRATCYPRFGMVGAKVALVAAPQGKLREALQEAVGAAEELPHSPLGGPWALDAPLNRGSYLFNFGGMSIDKVDDWIKLAQRLGINQIDFHGGDSFRFGDCRPNPKTYPEGFKSFKAVIDRLHAAGIAAGLHTYAFFLAKDCRWITSTPDPRLAKDKSFTLAADLTPNGDAVPVAESTAGMSTITGFFVHNSVTLHIDDELIIYGGASKESPFTFTRCKHGAYGTRPAAHAKGAKVHHLKECFGLFVPDPETTLFEEVAAHTADAFNACGFDMIYLDALDGEAILGGAENAWHYGSRFVYEIFKRLHKPALMEMSTFHHHLWCVRSRYCAWDHPVRSYKKFIDIHCTANDESRRMFLPGELGWWALKNWTGPQGEPTFPDDIEYLMAKGLATDTGFMMGIDPDNVGKVPALPRLANIIQRYEELRHSGKVPESIRARLQAPGKEFTLIGSLREGWQFRPVQYAKHKVENAESWSSRWKATNKFAAQPLRLRIEALMTAGPYAAPGNPTLADFASAADFPSHAAAPSVTAEWKPSKDVAMDERIQAGNLSDSLNAHNGGKSRSAAWAKWEKTFAPPRNLSGHQALGLWVHGDGQGEALNLQLKSPAHLVSGLSNHYIVVDFSGWRYFELIESEGDRYADYQWPYGDPYSIYRELIHFDQVDTLGLWYNNLPPDKPVTCFLSPIKAMPLVSATLVNPTVTIAGQTVMFPAEVPSGQYLELRSAEECNLYGPRGELVRKVKPEGAIPTVPSGMNEIDFQAKTTAGHSLRAQVTVITQGDALR